MRSAGQLILLLGSNHDGAVVAAARALVRVLAAEGRTLHDLAASIDRGDLDDDMAKLEFVLDHLPLLTDWEANFARSVRRQRRISEKQAKIIDRIMRKLTAQEG
jgi:hypothetical protein